MARTLLTSDVTYYVSAGGSDSAGDGASANPWATPSHAWDWCRENLDLGGKFKVTLRIQSDLAGTFYLEGAMVGQKRPEDFLIFGDVANPYLYKCTSAVAGDAVFRGEHGAKFKLQGLTLKNAAAGGFGIISSTQSFIKGSDLYFDTMGNAAVHCSGGGSWFHGDGTLTFLWTSFNTGFVCEDMGTLILPCPIQISGCPSFANAFVQADLGGVIDATNMSLPIPGTPSGSRYHAISNGIVFTGGTGNPDFFPGNSAGVVTTGGVYG